MAQIILPILGCVLLVIALSRIILSRTPVTFLNLAAATCGLVAFALWPDQYAIAFDHWIHDTGVGFYLSRVTITAAATLHLIAVAYGIRRWSRVQGLLLVPPVLLFTGLYTLFWILVHSSHASDLEALFYHGYHGRPDVVFWMSMARCATILWYSAYGVYIYAVVALVDYRTHRRPSGITPVAAMSVVFLGSFVIGAIDMFSAIADRSGVPSRVIATLATSASVGLVAIIGIFVVVYVIYLLARPSWVLLQEGRAAPQRLAEIRAENAELKLVRADIRDLSTRVDDKMLLMLDYADLNIVSATEEACMKEHVNGEEREVVVAAAREITLRPDHILQLRKVGDQALPPGALDLEEVSAGARYFAALSERDLYFYSDADIVASLALGAEKFGIHFRREPQDWHRRLGDLLARVLEAYDQPESYIGAYKRELERRAAEKRKMINDLGLADEDIAM